MTKSIDEIVVTGNLSELTPEQQTTHYLQVCAALGLDHRLTPLKYIYVDNNGNRDLVLYVLRNGTDQLRKLNGIKITKLTKEILDNVCTYIAEAQDKHGQTDMATGAVSLTGKAGQERANAIMAAETKAKRRVTLSISGCGLMDETEVADLTSKVTVVEPGIGVSTVPTNLAVPKVNNSAAAEVAPRFVESSVYCPDGVVPPARDPRIDLYKLEVLQAGGIQSVAGFSIGAKWAKFILSQVPGKKLLKDVTAEEWKAILDKLDEIRAKMGDKGVVFHIEETIKEKS